jgi:hypothetical protein
MKERKSERRFNILDAALILLLILAIVGVWQRSNLQKLFTVEELLDPYTVTFEIKKVRSTTVDLLQKDTALYMIDGEERVALGTLTQQVAASAATVYLQDREGNTVKAVYPQDAHEYLLDVSGELACAGVEHDGSFLVGGRLYLAVNQTVIVQTESADLEIRITGIEKMV